MMAIINARLRHSANTRMASLSGIDRLVSRYIVQARIGLQDRAPYKAPLSKGDSILAGERNTAVARL